MTGTKASTGHASIHRPGANKMMCVGSRTEMTATLDARARFVSFYYLRVGETPQLNDSISISPLCAVSMLSPLIRIAIVGTGWTWET